MPYRVGLIFGGPSAEHEVSIMSARNVYRALKENHYLIDLIYIDRDSGWYLIKNHQHLHLLDYDKVAQLTAAGNGIPLALLPGNPAAQFLYQDGSSRNFQVDVVFPIMHGRMVEDGALQGLLELMKIPYVGSRVLGSAINMDKEVSKRLCREAGILTARWLSFYAEEKAPSFEQIKEQLGLPFFLKPANTGSSIGIHKIKSETDYRKALEVAKIYDDKLIAEEFIAGREIEVSVFGVHKNTVASVAGEIIPAAKYEFYTYEGKYFDPEGAELIAPAKLQSETLENLQKIACQAFDVLCCEGLARVDFFVEEDKIYLNEINTMPGFTQISMYPRLFALSGKTQKALVAGLIEIALKRQQTTDYISRAMIAK